MSADSSTVIVLVPGHGEDGRIWGNLAGLLSSHGDVREGVDLARLDKGGDVVLVASGNSASAAIHAAAEGRARALILLSPTLAELLPDLDLDVEAVAREVPQDLTWMMDILAMTDPEERRRSFADGSARMAGSGLPDEDVARLREMYFDRADAVLARRAPSDRPRPYADVLQALDVPVLLVGVGRNELAVATLKALLRRTSRGELLLLDTPTTPYPWLARPEETAAAVTDFLDRVGAHR